jgi:hypothetical protein
LHLLLVGERDTLLTVGDRRLLAVGFDQHEDTHDRGGNRDGDQRARNEEPEGCLHVADAEIVP